MKAKQIYSLTMTLILACAIFAGCSSSSSDDVTDEITDPVLVISPAGGSSQQKRNVTITCTNSRAEIRYTLDGTDPSETHGDVYTGPIGVYRDVTIKAVACRSGSMITPISEETYTVPATANGIPQDGYPDWNERTMLVFMNMARLDPAEFKTMLGWESTDPGFSTWTATHPLYWNYALNLCARDYSTDMKTRNFFSHTNPEGLTYNDRVDAYYPDAWAFGENIATGTAPYQVMVMWMDDAIYADTPWTVNNGHRYNIMNPQAYQSGVGYYSNYYTAEFILDVPASFPVIPSGSHYLHSTDIVTFWLNYYDEDAGEPGNVLVVVDDSEYDLTLDSGTAAKGTYKTELAKSSATRSYYFIVVDSEGYIQRYPGSGQFRTVGEGSDTTVYVP